ncbi:hypothetical protein P7K49_028207 [Saguinus oedipus]|uniref:Uncharacterized protein n=1 Tax=Saguinus oedipus TaxID=9490 RepID=A0ABQ9UBM8_SAGOE|nr:hypothetical protein P7K49_028207 [Saguinus oedipus]
MDPAPSLGCSLKDVKWSSVAMPLDLLVSTYRLPQIARLDNDGRGQPSPRGWWDPGRRRILARSLDSPQQQPGRWKSVLAV